MASQSRKKEKDFSNNPMDFPLLIIVLIMLSLGIVMVLSASSPTSLSETGSSYTYVKTQILSAGLGLVGMFIISKIDYRIYKNLYKLIYLGIIVLNAAVAVIGYSVGRSKKMDRFRFYKFSTIRTCKNRINYLLCGITYK